MEAKSTVGPVAVDSNTLPYIPRIWQSTRRLSTPTNPPTNPSLNSSDSPLKRGSSSHASSGEAGSSEDVSAVSLASALLIDSWAIPPLLNTFDESAGDNPGDVEVIELNSLNSPNSSISINPNQELTSSALCIPKPPQSSTEALSSGGSTIDKSHISSNNIYGEEVHTRLDLDSPKEKGTTGLSELERDSEDSESVGAEEGIGEQGGDSEEFRGRFFLRELTQIDDEILGRISG